MGRPRRVPLAPRGARPPVVDRDRPRDRRDRGRKRRRLMRRGLRFGAGGARGDLARRRPHPRDPGVAAPAGGRPRAGSPLLLTRPAPPETFLAWVPRGLPDGFAARVARRPEIGGITVVAEDNVWLARSWSAAGELVDRPARPYRIPLDVAAVDPASFAPFLPPADRATLAAVENGEGILGIDIGVRPTARPRRAPRAGNGSAHPDRGGPPRRAGRSRGAPRVEGRGPPHRGDPRPLPPDPAGRRPVDDVRITAASDPGRSCRAIWASSGGSRSARPARRRTSGQATRCCHPSC